MRGYIKSIVAFMCVFIVIGVVILIGGNKALATSDGWVQSGDTWYYYSNGSKLTGGFHYIDDNYYYFDSSTGAMKTGWVSITDGDYTDWFYCWPDGHKAMDEWIDYNGETYYSGWSLYYGGWYFIDGKWYEFNDTWELIGDDSEFEGWVKLDDFWYYYIEPGVYATDLYEDEETGLTYYFSTYDGAALSGLLSIDDEGEYYFDHTTFAMVTGWHRNEDNENRVWLYMDEDGKVLWGWQEIDDETYYFGIMFTSDGEYIGEGMNYGWNMIDDEWYHFKKSGELETGWQKINGKWYLLDDETGAMQTGWHKVDGEWYYMSESGAMVTGWFYDETDNYWYYLDNSGAMVTGWNKINGTWYYMNNSGRMQTGWQYIDGVWYYLKKSGAMQTGWQYINNKWYYLRNSGAMAHDTYIDGYYVNSSGAWV